MALVVSVVAPVEAGLAIGWGRLIFAEGYSGATKALVVMRAEAERVAVRLAAVREATREEVPSADSVAVEV